MATIEFRVYAMAGVRAAVAVLAVFALLSLLGIVMAKAGDLEIVSASTKSHEAERMWEYEFTEKPFFRNSERAPTTSSLLDFIDLDDRMTHPEKQQEVGSFFNGEGLADFLFQVNNLEGEGFETYEETRDAIENGALALGDEIQSDKRLEALRSLYKSLRCLFPADDDGGKLNSTEVIEEDLVQLSVSKIVEAHRELMRSSKPEIAGRLRTQPNEVVFTRTVNGGFHVFMWPTQVEEALEDLIERANADLQDLQNEQSEVVKMRNLLKLGARLFFEFESIHPFLDGNGRIGRILLATVLRSVMPVPTVLYTLEEQLQLRDPPFVNKLDYLECFSRAQEEQKYEMIRTEQGYRFNVSQEHVAAFKRYPPEDLAALIVESVFVGLLRLRGLVSVLLSRYSS